MLSLRNGAELIPFHSANPATVLGTVAVTGLQAGETLLGIDRRPSNGQVYGVGSTSRLYRLDVITGVATALGGAFTPTLSGARVGLYFDPVNDRLRLVSDAEQNLTLDADTGAVVTPTEPALAPAGTIVAAAYVANVDGARGIDRHALRHGHPAGQPDDLAGAGDGDLPDRAGRSEGAEPDAGAAVAGHDRGRRPPDARRHRLLVLLANSDVAAATVTATFLRTTGAPVVKTFAVQPGARLTITTGPGTMVPELANESFGVLVSSDRPIFVEHAIYSNTNTVFWAAGSAATATALP